jgi:hypothetical protein
LAGRAAGRDIDAGLPLIGTGERHDNQALMPERRLGG